MNSLYGNFRQRKFTDIFGDAATFLAAYKNSGLWIEANRITDASCNVIFNLLYSKYGNSVIASSDENQFSSKVFSIIFEYGPTWEKKLAIQYNLRNLTDTDLLTGSKQIANHSFNPSSAPSTGSLTELDTINEQNTVGYKKSKMDAYALLLSLLENDVTAEFIDKFKKLFLVIVEPELPLWYITDTVTEEEEEA